MVITFHNAAEYLSKFRMTFYVMVGFPLLIFVVIYALVREGNYPAPFPLVAEWILVSVPIACAMLTVYAYVNYFKQLKTAKQHESLREKLSAYYQVSFNKFMVLAVTTLLDLVIYGLTGHAVFAGIYIAMLILFAMNNPSYYTVVGALKLPKAQRETMKENMIID